MVGLAPPGRRRAGRAGARRRTRRGLATLLRQLVNSPGPALRQRLDPSAVARPVPEGGRGKPRSSAVALRTLKLLAALTAGRRRPRRRHRARARRGQRRRRRRRHQARLRRTGLKGGLKGQHGVDGLYDEIERARGLLDPDGVVPPGYAKVVDLTIRGDESGHPRHRDPAQLRDVLRDARPTGRAFKDVLLDEDGKPAVNGLSLISPTSGQPDTRRAERRVHVRRRTTSPRSASRRTTHLPTVPPASVNPHFTPFTTNTPRRRRRRTPTARAGGGHRYGIGAPNKTEFPKTWTEPASTSGRSTWSTGRSRTEARQRVRRRHDTPPTGTSISPPQDNRNQMDVERRPLAAHGTVERDRAGDHAAAGRHDLIRVPDRQRRRQERRAPALRHRSRTRPTRTCPYRNPGKPPGKPRAAPQPGGPAAGRGYCRGADRPERPPSPARSGPTASRNGCTGARRGRGSRKGVQGAGRGHQGPEWPAQEDDRGPRRRRRPTPRPWSAGRRREREAGPARDTAPRQGRRCDLPARARRPGARRRTCGASAATSPRGVELFTDSLSGT